MKKLVIWDFDGVIADTENLLLQSRIDILSEKFKIDLDMDTIMKDTLTQIAELDEKACTELFNKVKLADAIKKIDLNKAKAVRSTMDDSKYDDAVALLKQYKQQVINEIAKDKERKR